MSQLFLRLILSFCIFSIVNSSLSSTDCTPGCLCGCVCKWKSGKRTVECTDRGLIMIPEGIEPDTLILDVSGNNLQILPRETFQRAGLVNIQKLYLKSCRLGQIDDYAFKGLKNLIELDLSNNLLTYVPSHAFTDISFLRNVSLSRNPIQKIDPFAFQAVPSLTKLDLSSCSIQSIGPKAFDGLEHLEHLKLNENQLSSLPANTVNNLHRVRTVELYGNKWKCDCHLRATRMWLAEYNVHVPRSIYCSGGPDRLKDHAFFELSGEDFACKPQIKVDTRIVEAISGRNASIECRIESDPVAKITWYYNGRSLANYSLFIPNQRIFISQTGENIYDMRSKLILTNVQPSDAAQYYCVAENRAGSDEANFTLNVLEASVGLAGFDGSNFNIISLVFGLLVIFMLIVIVILFLKIRRNRSDIYDEKSAAGGGEENNFNSNKNSLNKEKSTNSETSSTTAQSHDSVYKSDSGKAFTITSDLSYSRSLSDIGNPQYPQFSNPDLISSAHLHHGGSSCGTPLPITRPISDYCQNWPRAYPAGYEPGILDTVSAGSVSDEVFASSRVSQQDYPSDYGLPILPENGMMNGGLGQPCAKTLKVWQRGVPVYPPMCNLPYPVPVQTTTMMRNSPGNLSNQRCGTDV